jgi:hypothetical protein
MCEANKKPTCFCLSWGRIYEAVSAVIYGQNFSYYDKTVLSRQVFLVPLNIKLITFSVPSDKFGLYITVDLNFVHNSTSLPCPNTFLEIRKIDSWSSKGWLCKRLELPTRSLWKSVHVFILFRWEIDEGIFRS